VIADVSHPRGFERVVMVSKALIEWRQHHLLEIVNIAGFELGWKNARRCAAISSITLLMDAIDGLGGKLFEL